MAFLMDAYDRRQRRHPHRAARRSPTRRTRSPCCRCPKDTLTPTALEVFDSLKRRWMVDYDETQSIGKRYARQDEVGTPYCVTVDFDTLDDCAVTVRERDTREQDRVSSTNSRAISPARADPAAALHRAPFHLKRSPLLGSAAMGIHDEDVLGHGPLSTSSRSSANTPRSAIRPWMALPDPWRKDAIVVGQPEGRLLLLRVWERRRRDHLRSGNGNSRLRRAVESLRAATDPVAVHVCRRGPASRPQEGPAER